MNPALTNIHAVAKALGGDAVGACKVIAPGPGHSARDRSMSILLSSNAPDGFTVTSFAGDDWRTSKDYVRNILGLVRSSGCLPVSTALRRADNPAHGPHPSSVADYKSQLALKLWREAVPIVSTPAEAYLSGRGLELYHEAYDSHVLRFHPACPFRLVTDVTVKLPAMLAAMVDIRTDVFRGIHRTALAAEGRGKTDTPGLGNPKKMLGPATGACVKLSPDEDVTQGLHIAEGIETALACLAMRFRPIWVALSAGGMARFPVLPGIEALTIFADRDEAGRQAARACSNEWVAGGREVTTILPEHEGTDFAERPRP